MSDRLDVLADALRIVAVVCAAVWFVRYAVPAFYRLALWGLS